MAKVFFKNEFYQSIREDNGSVVITILKDDKNFLGIDATGCKLITNKRGFCEDEPSESVKMFIVKQSKGDKTTELNMWSEIRCRHTNNLMGMVLKNGL